MTWLRRLPVSWVLLCWAGSAGCRSKESTDSAGAAPVPTASRKTAQAPRPHLLYLPDAGDEVQNQGNFQPEPTLLPRLGSGSAGCPVEMVSVRGQFCIDRYEASMVDTRNRALSPYYPPAHAELVHVLRAFGRGDVTARGVLPALPLPPDFSVREEFKAVARSAEGVIPSGYMSGVMARRACEAAGKRLCSPAEWTTACRGERGTKFPYGESYADGGCNVFREAHPAVVLYGDSSKNHLDPRLNLAAGSTGSLLRKTGATSGCRSTWGQDGAYDMVGNLDEWVDSDSGAFQGGFYARNTREGCEARINVHPPQYSDYSLGVRCCQ